MVSPISRTVIAICMSQCLLARAPALPDPRTLNNTPCVVKLLSPIDTRTARPQNTFTAAVQQPASWKGAYVEGRINHVLRPARGNGKAEIDFSFETLTYGGQTLPITADLDNVENSQGVSNVDDEGRVIGRSSAKKKAGGAAGGAAMGAIIGGLTHGAAGAIAGGAVGAVAGYIIAAKLSSSGSDIRFGPGSSFFLRVSYAKGRR